MAIQRISLRNFDNRLVLNPPQDQIPPTALRRARGLRAIPTNSLLSRWGSTKLYDIANVNSLFKFDGDRFAGTTAGAFYRNGVSIKTGLDGDRLTAVSMSPTPSIADYLMIAGGGVLFKVDGSGAVTNWGIPPAGLASSYMLNSDCSSLSGWTDYDTIYGESTQTTFDSKSCFKFTFSDYIATSTASRLSLLSTPSSGMPDEVCFNFDFYIDKWYSGDRIELTAYLSNTYFDITLYQNGYTYVGGVYTLSSPPAEDTWHNYKVHLNLKTNIAYLIVNSTYVYGPLNVTRPAITSSDALLAQVREDNITGGIATVYFNNIQVAYGGFTAAVGTQGYKVIEDFEAYTDWTNSGFATIGNETTIKKAGTNSCKLTLNSGKTGKITQNVTLDLTAYTAGATGVSPEEDYISFWMYCDNVSALNYLQIEFSLNDTNFNDAYTIRTEQYYAAARKRKTGVASTVTTTQQDLTANGDTGSILYDTITATLTDAEIPAEDNTWKNITIPKSAFRHIGSRSYDWSDVKALRISARATKESAITLYLDDMQALGGAGLQGDYIYAVTFLNSTTGHRSNQVGKTVTIKDVARTPVALSAIPQPLDPQCDRIEIWRTLGHGNVLFKVDDIATGTTTYTDTVADLYALNSTEGAVYLSQEELPLDNDPPEPTFSFCAGPYNASCFWLSGAIGKKGRVYYSPIGRPEAVEGYLSVTNDQDPLVALCVFSGALFAFSYSKVYQIVGTNPYMAREVFMVPGTRAPFTVRATPAGIVYQAEDGVRLFNGSSSELGTSQLIHRVFNGEAIENLSAFEGVIAEYARGEYVIASTANTLAASGDTGTWRDLGLVLGALCFEPDTGKFMAATSTKVLTIEDEGVYADDGTAITFAVDTASIRAPDNGVWLVEAMEFDANTGNNVLAASALIGGTAVSLGNIQTTTRSGAAWAVHYLTHFVGARLTGSLTTASSEVFGIIIDVIPVEMTVRIDGADAITIPGTMSYDRTYVQFRLDDLTAFHPAKAYLDWQMLYAEINCNGNSVTPYVYIQGETLTLASTATTTRDAVTWPLNRLTRMTAVRMYGTFSNQIELCRVELDARVPKRTS